MSVSYILKKKTIWGRVEDRYIRYIFIKKKHFYIYFYDVYCLKEFRIYKKRVKVKTKIIIYSQ